MSWGDPEQMTDEQRAAGVSDPNSVHTPAQRELCDASGRVSDHRRLVAFIYLVLRDSLTVGWMGEIMLTLERLGDDHFLTAEPDPLFYEELLEGVVDVRTHRMLTWFWLLGHVDGRHPTWMAPALQQLPAQDDTTTVFTNGWLANYAKYIVEQLQHGDGETTKRKDEGPPT